MSAATPVLPRRREPGRHAVRWRMSSETSGSRLRGSMILVGPQAYGRRRPVLNQGMIA